MLPLRQSIDWQDRNGDLAGCNRLCANYGLFPSSDSQNIKELLKGQLHFRDA
jgi:hypothetical protein